MGVLPTRALVALEGIRHACRAERAPPRPVVAGRGQPWRTLPLAERRRGVVWCARVRIETGVIPECGVVSEGLAIRRQKTVL